MAFGLDEPEKQQAFLFGLLLMGAGYVFYAYVWSPLHEERAMLEDRVATLEVYNDQARALTQPSRLADLREREAEFQVALAAYETMLPSHAEVSTLLEEVARAALTYQVDIVNFAPLDPVAGETLMELPYDIQVQGDYHDIGRFLASVANLPRLVRPVVVSLGHVEEQLAAGPEAERPVEHEVLATLTLSTFLPPDGRAVGVAPPEGDTTLTPGLSSRAPEVKDAS
ncbi:MAG: type 4a pilus biogenesis protein PilO [Gemmatimonadetes bacterium]|nr:type 4a pilus biogenesis protein PilO [Gemmatimonadota bacterium]